MLAHTYEGATSTSDFAGGVSVYDPTSQRVAFDAIFNPGDINRENIFRHGNISNHLATLPAAMSSVAKAAMEFRKDLIRRFAKAERDLPDGGPLQDGGFEDAHNEARHCIKRAIAGADSGPITLLSVSLKRAHEEADPTANKKQKAQ